MLNLTTVLFVFGCYCATLCLPLLVWLFLSYVPLGLTQYGLLNLQVTEGHGPGHFLAGTDGVAWKSGAPGCLANHTADSSRASLDDMPCPGTVFPSLIQMVSLKWKA